MPRIRSIKPDVVDGLVRFGGYEWNKLDPDQQPRWIYFAQGDDGGPIKIGCTTFVQNRLAEIQGGYPFGKLGLVGAIAAPRTMELRLHRRFDALRIRGEWFKSEPPLTDFILSLPEPTYALGR